MSRKNKSGKRKGTGSYTLPSTKEGLGKPPKMANPVLSRYRQS